MQIHLIYFLLFPKNLLKDLILDLTYSFKMSSNNDLINLNIDKIENFLK